jgi:hypothetical protein
MAARHADEQLLADAQVDDPVRVPLAGRLEGIRADIGQHHGHPGVAVEQFASDPHKAVPHRVHCHGFLG